MLYDYVKLKTLTNMPRNWFGRVSAIKELVPRIYGQFQYLYKCLSKTSTAATQQDITVEAAILHCIAFMDQSAISANVMRLIELTKLVQHPLISCYIRCYLCRISMRLNAADKSPHWVTFECINYFLRYKFQKCLNDWMQTYTHQPVSYKWQFTFLTNYSMLEFATLACT